MCNDERPRVHLDINGMQVTPLINTGSTHTLMETAVYKRLPRLTPLYATQPLQSISGHELPIRGACVVRIGNLPTEVLVCESLGVELLIGANLCNQHCIVDFTRRQLLLGDKSYPMTPIPKRENRRVLSTTHFLPQAPSPVINKVLQHYGDVFSQKSMPLEIAQSLPPAEIDTGTERPIRQNPYRLPFSKREKAEECINEMLRDGIIRPSTSPWASPITLVPKKDGSTRLCADYRRLNAITIKDAHPLPHIQDIFDQLQGASVFSTLDLKSGYWQVPMHPDSIPKTAISCFLGHFEFLRLPMGLTNAPAIFQRSMNKVLSGLIGKCCMVYLDDIVIYSKNEEQHAIHVKAVLQRLRNAGLQLKPSKCIFGMKEIQLLGYKVCAQGISPLPERVEAIRQLDRPQNQTAVRSFLGMANYYSKCIPGFATLALPLTILTQKKEPFRWGQEQQTAFDSLKQALVEAPIMAHPDPNKPYILYTDASDRRMTRDLSE